MLQNHRHLTTPKPPPFDESEPPSDESAESVELLSACLRPSSKPPPDESLNDESSSPILTTQRLSPIAKVSEPVAQRLSPTAKVFEPAEVPKRPSSNPTAKVAEPVAQRLSLTAKVFELAELPTCSSSNPAEVPERSSSNDHQSANLLIAYLLNYRNCVQRCLSLTFRRWSRLVDCQNLLSLAGHLTLNDSSLQGVKHHRQCLHVC